MKCNCLVQKITAFECETKDQLTAIDKSVQTEATGLDLPSLSLSVVFFHGFFLGLVSFCNYIHILQNSFTVLL